MLIYWQRLPFSFKDYLHTACTMCWAKPAKGVIQQHRDHVKIFRQNSWGNWNNLEIYAELSPLTTLPGKPESNQKILKHLFLTCCKWEFNAFLKQTFTLKSTCIYILKVKNASQKGLNAEFQTFSLSVIFPMFKFKKKTKKFPVQSPM